jgi:hypothetical protein
MIPKIGILIPDRNDRPLFLANCIRMMDNQTLKPDKICLVNYENKSNDVDITQRYRLGYENLNDLVDIILFIENDDYYHPTYIETMVNKWNELNNPDILGTNYTIYYHLELKKYFTMNHQRRASAMNTLIKTKLDLKFPVDNDPYTDIFLWLHNGLNGKTFKPENIISIGMKHGVGKCGGKNHVDYLERFINNDENLSFLQKNTDAQSFKFYSNLKFSK